MRTTDFFAVCTFIPETFYKAILFNRQKIFLTLVSGLLLTAAFPEWGFSYLAWIALVPLLVCLRDLSPGNGFRAGFMTGMVHYLTLMYWLAYTMSTYGNMPWYICGPVLFLFAAYLACYPAFFSMFLIRVGRGSPLGLLTAPLLWTALEYVRTFLFSGFPWELLGYTQFDLLPLIQIADITGVYGVSFLIVLVNAVICRAVLCHKGRTWHGAAAGKYATALQLSAVCLVAGTLWGYGVWRMQAVDRSMARAPSARISVVQGNIDQSMKWDRAFQTATTRKYVRLSLDAREKNPELVVWPETATPFYFLYHPRLTKMVKEGVRRTGCDFLIGSPSFSRRGDGIEYYNSAYLVHPDGTLGHRYDKVHLVPFGEYVPLKKWLPFAGKIVAHVGDFRPGSRGVTLDWQNYRLGVQICYEMIFPDLSRAAVGNGANLLFNLTNDAWYGRTGAPYQHFSMAVLRAVENHRWVVRAANTGISGFIDPVGRIAAGTSLFEDAVVTHNVFLGRDISFYTRWGDLFAQACLGGIFFIIVRQFAGRFGKPGRSNRFGPGKL